MLQNLLCRPILHLFLLCSMGFLPNCTAHKISRKPKFLQTILWFSDIKTSELYTKNVKSVQALISMWNGSSSLIISYCCSILNQPKKSLIYTVFLLTVILDNHHLKQIYPTEMQHKSHFYTLSFLIYIIHKSLAKHRNKTSFLQKLSLYSTKEQE